MIEFLVVMGIGIVLLVALFVLIVAAALGLFLGSEQATYVSVAVVWWSSVAAIAAYHLGTLALPLLKSLF